jgi:hypothetical protein
VVAEYPRCLLAPALPAEDLQYQLHNRTVDLSLHCFLNAAETSWLKGAGSRQALQ